MQRGDSTTGVDEARILVVDDDASALDSTSSMLAHAGFDVRGARNGAIGLEQVLTFRPDVVVFDFWMPVVDGRELLAGIREVARGRLGLVAMSGTPEVEDWCARVGVRQFVKKPFERDRMVDAVRRALDEARVDSVRTRISSNMPTAQRLRVDRAVLVVGPRDVVRPVRSLLRHGDPAQPGQRSLQVAVVEGVEDAIRALASFQLDAILACACADDPNLGQLLSEASVRGLPVVLDGPVEGALPAGVHVSTSRDPHRVVELLRSLLPASA